MELRQLRYFVTVADEGHFGRAAARLYISGPALSQQVRALERLLGSRLFDRTSRGVCLTAAGQCLLPESRSLLAASEHLQQLARDLRSDGEGVVRVGLYEPTSAAELTPLLLAAFRRAEPNVRVETVACLDLTAAYGLLASRHVDVLLAPPPVGDDQVTATPLFQEPRVLMVAARSPLAEREQLDIADFADRSVGDAGVADAGLRDHYWFMDLRVEGPVRRHEQQTPDFRALQHVVASGAAVYGAGLSSGRLLPLPGVTYRRVRGGAWSVSALASRATDHRPVVAAFSRTALAVTRDWLDLVPEARPVDLAGAA